MALKPLITALFILLASVPALAEVRVAFIELTDSNGRPIIMEKDGRFAHVAISFRNAWLHAYPGRGVELATLAQLKKLGRVSVIVTLSEVEDVSPETVKQHLGKAYDNGFSWSDERMYCSELVGKILHLPPRPMRFDPPYWPPQYQKLNGKPGISPDGLYKDLVQVR